MHFAIALITCDREQFGQPNYFEHAWASICRSGFVEQMDGDRFVIFEAGPGHERARRLAEQCGVRVLGAPPDVRLDVVRNMHRAFAWMAGTGCPFGMLLVDDLLMCRNTLARARAWVGEMTAPAVKGDSPLLPRGEEKGTVPTALFPTALFSLSSQYAFTAAPENVARGWVPYPVESFYGGLGAIVSREVLVGYLLSDFRQVVERRTSGVDMALKGYLTHIGAAVFAHCPNLIRHIGMGSTLGHAHRDDDHYFPGEDYNALTREIPGTEHRPPST